MWTGGDAGPLRMEFADCGLEKESTEGNESVMERSWKSDRRWCRTSPWVIFLGILNVDWMGCVSDECGNVLGG